MQRIRHFVALIELPLTHVSGVNQGSDMNISVQGMCGSPED